MRMRMKTAWTVMLSLLCLCLLLPIPVYATENTVTISVSVPEENNFTVILDIGEHGAVISNGIRYTGTKTITAVKESELTYFIFADSGYELEMATYNGDQIEVIDDCYKASSLLENSHLVVRFKEIESKPKPDEPGESDAPTTGDISNPVGNIMLLLVSGSILLVMIKKSKRQM